MLLELWPLAGAVGCVGWPWRCASLVVGGGSSSWLVELAALQEGRLFESSHGGKWAEIGASASLSECCDRLHRVCCPCFVFGVV